MVSAARMSRRSKKPASVVAGSGAFTLFPTSTSGYVDSSSTASYITARTGDAKTAYPGNIFQVGQVRFPPDTYTSETWDVSEGFLSFDTSGVTGTISTATLSLGLESDLSGTDFTMQARVRDWGATLEATDYVPGADLGALTLVATLASAGIGAVNSYKAMAENGTALRAAINQAGFTRLILCSDRTISNIAPPDAERLRFHGYDHATLKSKLVVTTT